MNVPMPPRNTTAEIVARAAARCLRLACSKHFPRVSLGQIAEIVSGGTPATNRTDFWDGDVVWVTPKDLGKPRAIEVGTAERSITVLGLQSSSARLLPAGTVLLSSRAPIGHLAITTTPLATNQGLKNVICSDRVLNRYVFHMLRGAIDELQAQGRGNTFAEIPAAVVKSFEVPLPPKPLQVAVASFLDALYLRLHGQSVELPPLPEPVEEQRRIVTRIEDLAARIEEARGLRREAMEETRWLLAARLRVVYESGAEQHGTCELGGLLLDAGYGSSEKCSGDRSPGAVPVLRIPNVSSERIVSSPLKFARLPEPQKRNLLLADGDLLVVRTNGSLDLVGRCAVVEGLIEATAFASYLIRLRCDRSRLAPVYAQRMLQHLRVSGQLVDFARTTAGQYNVSLGRLRGATIPVPPLPEQACIASELDTVQAEIEKLQQVQAQAAADVDALLPSILNRAFKGEL